MNELIELLRENVVQIRFTKADGTERVLKGTLRKEYLPVKEGVGSTVRRSVDVTCVWDVENSGFRSFRNDSIIDYVIIDTIGTFGAERCLTRGETYV